MTKPFDSVRATAVATALAVVLSTVAAAPAATASPAPAATTGTGFAVPEPTGRHPVGRDILHLVDRSRPDPWEPGHARELMVSMYYPATARPARPARYLTTAEARLFLADRGAADLIDAGELSGARTAARPDAAPRRGRYPLVVLSPGFTLHRHTLTFLAEQLASRGYVVAALDHAYETSGTAFPGGRTLTCTACAVLDTEGVEAYARVAPGRAGDVSFLLDRLFSSRPAWTHAGLIDRSRVGMAGHSAGGNAAAATMAADRRIRAGVNMDGSFLPPVPAGGLDGRPFLMLGSGAQVPGGRDRTWDAGFGDLDGWKRWLTVDGTAHMDFTDLAVLADQAGIPDPESPLPGDRTVAIVRDYVTAFFDEHLRGIDQHLLDGPSAANPEVVFHQP